MSFFHIICRSQDTSSGVTPSRSESVCTSAQCFRVWCPPSIWSPILGLILRPIILHFKTLTLGHLPAVGRPIRLPHHWRWPLKIEYHWLPFELERFPHVEAPFDCMANLIFWASFGATLSLLGLGSLVAVKYLTGSYNVAFPLTVPLLSPSGPLDSRLSRL